MSKPSLLWKAHLSKTLTDESDGDDHCWDNYIHDKTILDAGIVVETVRIVAAQLKIDTGNEYTPHNILLHSERMGVHLKRQHVGDSQETFIVIIDLYEDWYLNIVDKSYTRGMISIRI